MEYLIWLDRNPSGCTAAVAITDHDHRVAVKRGENWTFITGPLTEKTVDVWFRHRLPAPEAVAPAQADWLDTAVTRLAGVRTVETVLGGIIAGALAAS